MSHETESLASLGDALKGDDGMYQKSLEAQIRPLTSSLKEVLEKQLNKLKPNQTQTFPSGLPETQPRKMRSDCDIVKQSRLWMKVT